MYHYSIQFHKSTLLKASTLFLAFVMVFSPLFTSLAFADETVEENTVEEEAPQENETVEQTTEEDTEEEISEESNENDGTDGEDSGSDETEDPEVIVTGDALAGGESETVANFNDTTVETSSSTEETDDENGSTTTETSAPTQSNGTTTASSTDTGEDIEAEVDEELPPGTPGLPGDTTSSTTNDAEVSNTASVDASTGENEVGDQGVILTGDAIAYANIVNLVNTNIFNSEGLIAFFSQAFGISSIDLRDSFSSIFSTTQNALSTPICGYEICTGGNANLAINNSNNATITNDVNVVANTGGNTAGDGGTIVTGDAYAAANIFNLANTNITDSNYLLLSFNNFGDYAGDILLPNGQLLDSLFGANGSSYGNVNSNNTNNANVSNDMSVGAETGDNEGSDNSLIATGDATANGTVQNTVNTNLFGGSDLVIVLRVHGDWDGEIFGLPEGIGWTETDGGIVLYSTGDGAGSPSSVGNVSVENNNNATINNNVSVFALTGDNKVGDEGTIVTGDAHAAANVTNVANTNILGQNWALLVFDIFGNWSGNLAFGQPNLWIGAKATPKTNPVMPGSEVEYTFTVTNRGDSIASDVVLDNFFKQHELAFQNVGDDLETLGNEMRASFEVGDLRPGETKTLKMTANIGSELPKRNAVPVSLQAAVYARENDANDDDNRELITVYSGDTSDNRGSKKSFPANVEVSKTSSSDNVEPGSSVDYTITVENTGGPLFRSMLRDVLTYEDGEMISEQYWELGTIQTDEVITIEYTMQFGTDMRSGIYTNSADAIGLEEEKSWQRGVSYESPAATHEITLGGAVPEVLGISTDSCPAYLNTFMKAGVKNSSEEVTKLQKFLNYHTGSNIVESGFFGFETEIAVKNFQREHAEDILQPWGMSDPSGYVYLTTRKKINEISCEYSREFPLSSGQQAEIDRFRIGVEVIPENSTSPLPLFGEAEDESEDDITLNDEEEAIKNEVAIAEEKKLEEPLSPSDDEETHPFVISVLRAINWFRDITPIANAFGG